MTVYTAHKVTQGERGNSVAIGADGEHLDTDSVIFWNCRTKAFSI